MVMRWNFEEARDKVSSFITGEPETPVEGPSAAFIVCRCVCVCVCVCYR